MHSFRTLLDDLAALTRNTVTAQSSPKPAQRRTFNLLEIDMWGDAHRADHGGHRVPAGVWPGGSGGAFDGVAPGAVAQSVF